MILGAAVLAAGVASSMASSVYSVNVVGYVNITAPPGFSLLANQLDLTPSSNTIEAVLGNAANSAALQDCQVEIFNKGTSSYSLDVYDASGAFGPPGWYDGLTGNPSVRVINPGTGFFFYNSKTTNVTLTVAGQVDQGTNTVPLTSGFNLISTIVPVQINLDTTATNNFPAIQDMEFLAFTNTIGHPANYADIVVYDTSGTFGPPGWYDGLTGNPATPSPAVGQGYFIYTPTGTNWSRFFQVQ